MLVLQRQIGESCIIAVPGHPPIKVFLVDVRLGRKVRIGFDADPGVRIHREEVWHRIERERIEREKSPDTDNAGGDQRAAG